MEYRRLIREFAASLGVEDLSFDAEGIARLQADDMAFAFMELPERGALLTWGRVATPPPERLEQLYRLLLEASFMGRATAGGTFTVCDGAVYLQRTDALVNLDVESLSKAVEEFLNYVEKWRGVIEAFRADDSAPVAAEPVAGPGFGSFDFIKV